ncbi:hypothetical protein FKM82_024436 [Ascaphus truei]
MVKFDSTKNGYLVASRDAVCNAEGGIFRRGSGGPVLYPYPVSSPERRLWFLFLYLYSVAIFVDLRIFFFL